MGVRTTVTLDDDVAERLRQVAHRRNMSFKTALNQAIRAGLAHEREGSRPYTLPSFRMNLRRGIDLTKALQLAGELEDEETIRKLERRK
jgi:predicted DNA-binding ribbon-helix-helix protein